jgi:hypothetical protein
VTAHSAVELERGQPADHLRPRQLQLWGDVRGAQRQHIAEVRDDPIPLRPKRETKPVGCRKRVVQDHLAPLAESRPDIPRVLNQPGSVSEQTMSTHGQR